MCGDEEVTVFDRNRMRKAMEEVSRIADALDRIAGSPPPPVMVWVLQDVLQSRPHMLFSSQQAMFEYMDGTGAFREWSYDRMPVWAEKTAEKRSEDT